MSPRTLAQVYNGDAVCVPLDPQFLAELLDTNARDWSEVLIFIENLAKIYGLVFDRRKVSELMEAKYQEAQNE